MKKKQLILLPFLSLFFCSCVWEELNPCDTHLCFVYDYNLQYTDLFPKEVSQLTVFIFDQNNILYRIYKDQANGTFPADYTMNVTLEEKDYTFVVWSGLDDDLYTLPLTRSETRLEELVVRLNRDKSDGKVKQQLPSLWYGKLQKNWDRMSPGTVQLIKDTNTIRLVMKNLDEDGEDVDINDFDIVLSCCNGVYNHGNEPQEEMYQYIPYYTTNHPESGAIAELNTLRLMSGQQNNLEIIHRETGENILGKKINLNTYFDALRLMRYSDLSLQEYLDRENQYGIVFFYKGFNKETHKFSSFSVQLNGWAIREQDLEF